MPANTPNRNYPYPLDADGIDVAGDIHDLATALDTDIDATMELVDNKVSVSGDTMTGMLTLPGTNPTSLNHAVRKGWADATYLNKTGDAMSGDLDMNNNLIHELGVPELDHDAARKSYVDGQVTNCVQKDVTGSQTMRGSLHAPSFVMTDGTEPSGPWHAVPLVYFNNHAMTNPMQENLNLSSDFYVFNSAQPPEDEGHPFVLPTREWVRSHMVNTDLLSNVTAATNWGGDWQSMEAAFKIFGGNGSQVSTVMTAGLSSLQLNREGAANAADEPYIRFTHNTNLDHGTIQIQHDGSGIDVTGTSDYRMKERLAPITDAARRVQALARRTFRGRWKGHATERDMLNAHDVAEAAPYAVYGEKDGDEMQRVGYMQLVPLLTAALGEALDRIDQLEARLP